MSEQLGTLEVGEVHPASRKAFQFVKEYIKDCEALILMEAFNSCAIEGNRNAEICGETLRRITNGEGVSDRYILGLAWTLKEMMELSKESK